MIHGIYILILIANINGTAATTAEFYDKQACEYARDNILDQNSLFGGSYTAICFPKESKD